LTFLLIASQLNGSNLIKMCTHN